MTEYDYSPEAYDRYMATQSRISNWIDSVTHSMQTQTPSPSSRRSYDHYPTQQQHHPHLRHSRPTYSQQQQYHPQQYQNTHSNTQSHSRSNSLSRTHSRSRHPHHHESTRPRSYSQTSGRPQPVFAVPVPPPPHLHPVHSRTYSYAMNQPPQPAPIPVPQPISYLAPRRSRTLPPQSQNVAYQTYDAPHGGGPTYVIVHQPPYGAGPHGQQQIRMQSPVTQTKRTQPLLKRLFTSFGPWGSSSSPKSKFAPQRRYRRRSSF